MEDIGLNCFPEGEIVFSQKHRNDFFVRFNRYLNSDEYESSAKTLLKYYDQSIESPSFQILTSIMFYLEKDFFLNLSTHLELSAPEPLKKLEPDQDMDLAGKGKLRYISGYVLAKLKNNLSKKIRNTLFEKNKESDLERYQSQMEIINSLCSSYDELNISAAEPETLLEVKRKQNERESLTNVSDLTFNFFQNLDQMCREKLTHERLVIAGKHLFSGVKEEIIRSSQLFETWIHCINSSRIQTESVDEESEDISDLLSKIALSCDSYIEIFPSVVILFLKVSFSQFRKDYLTFLKKEKGIALRKKVMKRSRKSS